jgi:hypothetical protein
VAFDGAGGQGIRKRIRSVSGRELRFDGFQRHRGISSYLAAEIGPGDEVIQPALNFVAAANITVACGASPVFADITEGGSIVNPAHMNHIRRHTFPESLKPQS